MITGFRIFLHPGCEGVAIALKGPGCFSVTQELGPGTFGDPPIGFVDWTYFYDDFFVAGDVDSSTGFITPPDPQVPEFPLNPYGNNYDVLHYGYAEQAGIYGFARVTTDDWYAKWGPLSFGATPDYNWLGFRRLQRLEQLLHSGQTASAQGDAIHLVEGDNEILAPMGYAVDISILKWGPQVNNWYGLPDTGKYGWVAAKYDGLSYGPIHHLNFQANRYMPPQG